jgi:hypothetical protein
MLTNWGSILGFLCFIKKYPYPRISGWLYLEVLLQEKAHLLG